VVDEVEQRFICPVQILEHEDERPLLRQRLEEAAPGGERLVPTVARAYIRCLDTGERSQVPLDPCCLRAFRDDRRDGSAELLLCEFGAVGFEDSGLRLDHLAEGPKSHPLPVGERATMQPADEFGTRVEFLEELEDKSALANPRYADERHQLGLGPALDAGERVPEQRQLPRSSYERRVARVLDAEPELGAKRLPDSNGLCFALGEDWGSVLIFDRFLGCATGCLVDEDAAGRRGRLEPRGCIDHVSGSDSLSCLWPRSKRDQRLAGGDADAHLELTVLGEGVMNGECGPHCSLGVVLVGDRRSEHGHDCVANELLHRAAVSLELRAQARVVRLEKRANLLRVHALCARREADEVGEEHRDDLTLLAKLAGVSGEWGGASVAEASAGRVLVTAARARNHGESVRRRASRL
jgi:hypothetical protein